jgi:hypothetical protein
MQSETKVFLESPTGDLKEVVVIDPMKDLIPLMAAGYHQVKIQEPRQQAEEATHDGKS